MEWLALVALLNIPPTADLALQEWPKVEAPVCGAFCGDPGRFDE